MQARPASSPGVVELPGSSAAQSGRIVAGRETARSACRVEVFWAQRPEPGAACAIRAHRSSAAQQDVEGRQVCIARSSVVAAELPIRGQVRPLRSTAVAASRLCVLQAV